MKDVDLPFCTIEELRDKAYAMVGEPDPVQFDDRIVGVIEARDGTIIDVVRQIKGIRVLITPFHKYRSRPGRERQTVRRHCQFPEPFCRLKC